MKVVGVESVEVVFSPGVYMVPQVHGGTLEGAVEATVHLCVAEGVLQL